MGVKSKERLPGEEEGVQEISACTQYYNWIEGGIKGLWVYSGVRVAFVPSSDLPTSLWCAVSPCAINVRTSGPGGAPRGGEEARHSAYSVNLTR